MGRGNSKAKEKIIFTVGYVAYWFLVALQGNESFLSIVLIASAIGYIMLNIVYESIDNRRI